MNYFQNKLNQANEEFLGADAWTEADAWNSIDGQEQVLNATASAADQSQSRPYIIKVVNTTTTDVANVEILNCAVTQFGYTPAGLTYSYGFSNITLQQFRASIASGQGFKAGLFRLFYTNATAATAQSNITEVVTLTTYSANGDSAISTYVPTLDDYQYQQAQVTIRNTFLVSAMVSLVINALYASTTVKVMIYPVSAVNQFDLIQGKNPQRSFAAPAVNPALGVKKG